MSESGILCDVLRDFWPCWLLAYYGCGLLMAACMFAWSEKDDMGYSSPAVLGWPCVALVFAGAALWPILAAVCLWGNACHYARQARRGARCSWL